MADYNIVGGSTDQTIYVYITDLSSANEIGKTGLTFESAGLVASYVRTGAARTAITLATQTANGAHSDGGFVLVDDTNMPGVYRLDLPDAAVAAGVAECVVQLAAEADSVCRPVRIQISPVPANVTQISGSAVSTTTAQIGVNVVQISADGTAADNCEKFFDGTGYDATASEVTTVDQSNRTNND